MFSRRKVAAVVTEFLGTAILAFVVVTVSRSQIGIPYFVGIGAGLTVMLFGLALARDVQLNPAYTIGMWTARRISTLKAVVFILAQMAGGACAYLLYKYFTETGVVQPLPTEFKDTILVAEALGAFVFTFAAANAIRHSNQIVRNVSTGLAYAIGVIVASVASAGFINPAVAMASNAWSLGTYVLGPILGAILGINLYNFLFADRERVEPVRNGNSNGSGMSSRFAVRRKLNKDAIEVSPANVEDKPLEKVEKAEQEVKAERSNKSGKKNKKSKK